MKKIIGDITSLTSGLIIHQANAQGVMRSGVAKAIVEKWPQVYRDYLDFCDNVRHPQNRLGDVVFSQIKPELLIASAIAQLYYGKDGKKYTSYDALDSCLSHIAVVAYEGAIDDIHFPMIGSGLGGGNWDVIQEIIKHRLKDFNLHLWVMEM